MKVSAIGNDYLSALTIMGWVVRRAACSVDIEVDRGRDLIGSLSLTKRKGGVQAQTFSASGECAHAVQWEAAGIRTQVYLKGLQLQRGIRRFRTSDDEIGHGSREHLAEVAKAAKNVVRFEVTIQTMAAMRKAVGIETPWFPTLGLLVHPGVASQIVSRELVKLRLENVEEQRQSASPDLLGLWDRLQAARKKSDGITDTSLRAALTAYLLLGTGVDQKELVRRGVYKRQTLDKIVRLLTKLGLPPAAVESFDVIGLREQYISRLREWLGGIPSPIPNFEPDGILAYVRAAPWISGDDDVIFDDGEPYDLP